MKNYGFVRVAAAIPSLRVANCGYNVEQMEQMVIQASEQGVHIVCFPELSVTGYTCADLFHQQLLLSEAEQSVKNMLQVTSAQPVVFIVGAPVRVQGKLFNAAIVCLSGKILGIVPKTYLPTYSEFYEKRWFEGASQNYSCEIDYAGQCNIMFGSEILFNCSAFSFGVELCEDLWTPMPPSSRMAVAGAQLIFNLSASNELIGKNNYLLSLIRQQSARCVAGYIYASAGWGESTTDVVYAGNAVICENGALIAKSERFQMKPQLIISEIDIERLNYDRQRITSFQHDAGGCCRVATFALPDKEMLPLHRTFNPAPFVPPTDEYDSRCREIFDIQAGGLAKRLLHTGLKKVVVGVSGGLDSTLALLACVHTYDRIGFARTDIIGITMPGFGTTGRTYHNALRLMQGLGITVKEISIKAACEQHFIDIGHDASVHDVTYENAQARERTQILMDVANQEGALVIGTGDMSELALGWATYNGDQMSMYGMNASIPKTLVRYLVRWFAETQTTGEAQTTLLDVLDTPVSPELLPADSKGAIAQKTENIIGPYELHDFFLYYFIRFGFSPAKIRFLAERAFVEHFDKNIIQKWILVFFRRFFAQQFKRSCMPDGPKVGSVNLSPRGDWRMPSDADASLWLKNLES